MDEMNSATQFVIVGAGLAGAAAAEELRDQGFTGKIVLIGMEQHDPYIRPPLSKDYLAGNESEVAWVKPHEWYAQQNIELRLGTRVAAIDRAAHTVIFDGGEAVHYDKLLIATGSSPRRLVIPGAKLPGVHYLRTVDDSNALRAELKNGDKRLVVLGSGWIGMEVAATARVLGNEVTIVQAGKTPLSSALGDELGQFFAIIHEHHGVLLETGVEVLEIVAKDGRVAAIRAQGRDDVPADLVVVGIGATPNVSLAEAAGLDVNNGILVDASLRTSDPDIFAAGDVANAWHPGVGLRMRSEHWANALNGGPAAARGMLGQDESYTEMPYFYTDQYDHSMQFSGYVPLTHSANLVFRGDPASGKFIAFWLRERRVVAGMNVNVWNVNDEIQDLIRRGNVVDIDRLSDDSVPLDSLY
jgi:3-phenylpropionate/trans-cinnamate dioxygenase ferredoxin reductase subunit